MHAYCTAFIFFGCHCIRAAVCESLQLSVLFLALGTRRMIAFSSVMVTLKDACVCAETMESGAILQRGVFCELGGRNRSNCIFLIASKVQLRERVPDALCIGPVIKSFALLICFLHSTLAWKALQDRWSRMQTSLLYRCDD